MRPLRALTLGQLRERRSLKWSLYGPDVLPLWVAEMDAPLAEPVTAVLADVAATGDLGYPEDSGYAVAFGRFATERWGWTPGASLPVVDVMTGVVESLRLTGRDTVIVNPPVYPPFFDAVRLAGARRVDVPLTDAWRLDPDRLAAAFAAHAGRATYLLCHPHNPTSMAASAGELEAVAELAARYGIRVVVDEMHAPLADPSAFTPYLSLPGTDDAFVVTSASKAWNLAGVKAGLVLAGPAVAVGLLGLPELVAHGASQVGIRVQTAAWDAGRDWLDAVRSDLAENRQILTRLLADHLPAAHAVMGPDSYLAWLDLRAYGWGHDPATTLRERAGVALGEGPPFADGDPSAHGFARLNYATTPEVLEEAFVRLARAID